MAPVTPQQRGLELGHGSLAWGSQDGTRSHELQRVLTGLLLPHPNLRKERRCCYSHRNRRTRTAAGKPAEDTGAWTEELGVDAGRDL